MFRISAMNSQLIYECSVVIDNREKQLAKSTGREEKEQKEREKEKEQKSVLLSEG